MAFAVPVKILSGGYKRTKNLGGWLMFIHFILADIHVYV